MALFLFSETSTMFNASPSRKRNILVPCVSGARLVIFNVISLQQKTTKDQNLLPVLIVK